MTITGAIVLYAVCWFMTLFVVLPIGVQSQEEAGDVVPGTPASPPTAPMLGKKFFWTTVWATGIWAIIFVVIVFELITVDDIDWFDRMTPPSDRG